MKTNFDIYKWREKTLAEFYVSYEITLKCNLYCDYCYNLNKLSDDSYEDKVIQAMTLRKFEKVLKSHPDTTVQFDILGGEPTIYDDLYIFVNKLIALGVKYPNFKLLTITTNGTIDYDWSTLNKAKDEFIYFNVALHNFNKDIPLLKENLVKYKEVTNLVAITCNLWKPHLDMEVIKDVFEYCDTIGVVTDVIDIHNGGNTIIYIDEDIRSKIYAMSDSGNIKLMPYEGKMVSSADVSRMKLWTSSEIRDCTISGFNIEFNGNITPSCNYDLPHRNIKTHDIDSIHVRCPIGTSCQGSVGFAQTKHEVK